MGPAELALLLFNAVNCIRLLAYVPQIVAIVRDRHGAEAVSCLSWALFALAHFSTAVYAWFAFHDAWMAVVFTVNFTACTLIIAITVCKRAATHARSTRLAVK